MAFGISSFDHSIAKALDKADAPFAKSVRELTCYPRESGKRLVYLYVSTWYLSCWQIPRGCGTDIVRLE